MPQLIARASNTVRNKNIAMIVLCVAFLGWFTYDGFYAWPRRNDHLVPGMINATKEVPQRLDSKYLPTLESWKGWNKETHARRQQFDEAAKVLNLQGEGWHSTLDMAFQRWIVLGLVGAVAGAIWWTLRCQKRRVIADENRVSPSEGVVIPLEKIKVVDNSRWQKAGIVTITYIDEKGQEQTAKFDDYETDREPLIQILDLMGEKAMNAEFLPKEEPQAQPAKQNP